jgi:hypothetical protein
MEDDDLRVFDKPVGVKVGDHYERIETVWDAANLSLNDEWRAKQDPFWLKNFALTVLKCFNDEKTPADVRAALVAAEYWHHYRRAA